MKRNRRKLFCWIVLTLLFSPGLRLNADPPPAIKLELKELRKQLPVAEVTVYNPDYRRKITYEGFWLDEVLQTQGVTNRSGDELVFKCADGYTTLLPLPGVGVKKWLLAYGEKSGTWTPLVHNGKTLSPGPWYVVGTTADSFQEFPWPYQVVTLEITKSW